ncbi:flagellar hook-basal body complex protein FliE [Congregibacter variabilis]|uniref:Flagellar hook-basal body complex protein FliE n=1 Tax=Congregibacter variabilis TaxID=3081200 RepID=A0ABZ0I5F3_9GAMM|nr:flagellar hook-basal body complex protein FliE [Congregibacter sp. IMCC43200]
MSDIAINQVIAQMRSMASAAGSGSEASGAEQVSGANFSTLMQDSIEEVNASMMQAKALATSFESGDPQISVTEVMVASQRAGLEFQAMTEVRNKLLTAYQEIMSMQV